MKIYFMTYLAVLILNCACPWFIVKTWSNSTKLEFLEKKYKAYSLKWM
jgi:hypothetical protein